MIEPRSDGEYLGDEIKDLIFSVLAAGGVAGSLYYGVIWLAVVMAFVTGSLLTFALTDYRDKLRRQLDKLKPP